MSDWAIIRRAAAELRPYRRRTLLAALAVTVRSALFMVPAALTKQILDQAIGQGNRPALWLYSGLTVLATVLAVFLILVDLLASSYVQQVSAHLRTRLYGGLLDRPMAFFRQTKTGELLTRLLQDSESFTALFFNSYGGGLWSTATWAVVSGSIALAMMLWLDPLLALPTLLFYPLEVLLIRLAGARVRAAAAAETALRAGLTETVRESVTGIGYLKAAGLEAHLLAELDGQLQGLEAASRRTVLLERLARIATMPEILTTPLVYLLGAYHVMAGRISLGALIAFLLYAEWLKGPVAVLHDLYITQLKRLAPALTRTFAMVDEASLQAEGPTAGSAGAEGTPEAGAFTGRCACRGEVIFDHVTYGYDPDCPVLRDLSFRIAPGEVVAFVGPSGAGKSTLADLMLGMARPQSGGVRLDGHDLKALDPRWVRQNVAAVAQDVTVLNDSVLANVTYGRPDSPPDTVASACADACAAEFIAQLPQGMSTPVGERGTQLSGGQRQRLSVARVLLYDPRVLILDEATSALDYPTETALMEAIRRRFAGRTLILIAHRLSTVAHADRILVLDQGRIVQQGTHLQLMAEGGLYRALYAHEAQGDDRDALTAAAPASAPTESGFGPA